MPTNHTNSHHANRLQPEQLTDQPIHNANQNQFSKQEGQPSPYHQALHSPQTRHHNHMIICCTYSGYLDKTTHVYLALNSPWQASCNRGPAAAITLSSSCRFMQIMAKIAGIQHQNLGPVQHHIMTAVIQMRPYQAVDWQDQTYMTLACKISILPYGLEQK